MLRYLVRRLLLTIPILFAIILVTFAFSHALPGGPFDASGQKALPPHIRAQLEQQFNLQKPVFFNLPSDGAGSETAWGETLSIKGHSDTGFVTEAYPPLENAGIRLYGEYHLLDNGNESCLGQKSEAGWAIVSQREVCVIKGGGAETTFTEVQTHWYVDVLDAQFWIYLGNIIQLDFGPSLNVAKVQENKQVIDDFKERIPVSIQLGLASTLLGFTLGIPLGVIAAAYHNTPIDYAATFFAVFGQSVPSIVLAPLLILVFAVELDILPVADPLVWKDNPLTWDYMTSVTDDPFNLGQSQAMTIIGPFYWSAAVGYNLYEHPPQVSWAYFQALLLPSLTIGTGMSAGIARLTRATLLQVLNEDYIRTARSKGLKERQVLYIHALKNAMIPVATSLGGLIVAIVSGSFVIELIFSIPGMGVTFIDAVNSRDYTTIMGVTVFYSVILIIGNILVDVVYTWLDPRIHLD